MTVADCAADVGDLNGGPMVGPTSERIPQPSLQLRNPRRQTSALVMLDLSGQRGHAGDDRRRLRLAGADAALLEGI